MGGRKRVEAPPAKRAAGDARRATGSLAAARCSSVAGSCAKEAGPEALASLRRGPVVSHVEAERLRRYKLHRRFCDLPAAVHAVSRMDKASLLADATAYISELRARVREVTQQQAAAAAASSSDYSFNCGLDEEKLEVRMVGSSSNAARHAPARLMVALRWRDLQVQHASAALRDEGSLRANLLRSLQESG